MAKKLGRWMVLEKQELIQCTRMLLVDSSSPKIKIFSGVTFVVAVLLTKALSCANTNSGKKNNGDRSLFSAILCFISTTVVQINNF
jgi:hypothetical protein